MNSYYEICDDVNIQGRWFLKGPYGADGKEIDPREFTDGKPMRMEGKLTIPLRREGEKLDFTFADFDMPVVREEIANIMETHALGDIQRFPATIESHPGKYDIINATKLVKCLDETRSRFMKWKKGDHREDFIGQYRMVTKLKIDKNRTKGENIFRIWGWEVVLICSEKVKDALELNEVTGIKFQEV